MRKQVIGSLFALLVVGQLWAQNLYTRYERMLTLPEGYVCYRTNGKIKLMGSWMRQTGRRLSLLLLL